MMRSYTFTDALGSNDLCFAPIADMLNHVGVGQSAALGVVEVTDDEQPPRSGGSGGASRVRTDGIGGEEGRGGDAGVRKRKKRRTAGSKAEVTSGDVMMAMHTILPLDVGDEIMNHYGELGDAALLHRYGFVEAVPGGSVHPVSRVWVPPSRHGNWPTRCSSPKHLFKTHHR
jgi:hypothetical protein